MNKNSEENQNLLTLVSMYETETDPEEKGKLKQDIEYIFNREMKIKKGE